MKSPGALISLVAAIGYAGGAVLCHRLGFDVGAEILFAIMAVACLVLSAFLWIICQRFE